ncbi:hypothetical protein Tco_1154948 [Tanacetum coccineum]
MEKLNEEAIRDSFPDEHLMAVHVRETTKDPCLCGEDVSMNPTLLIQDRIHMNLLDMVLQLYYPFSLTEYLKADNPVRVNQIVTSFLVLVRQLHMLDKSYPVDTSLIHIESFKSPTAELFQVDSGRISIRHYLSALKHADTDTYSASAKDIEVQSCFFDDQLTSLSPPSLRANDENPPPPVVTPTQQASQTVSTIRLLILKKDTNGQIKVLPPETAKEILARERERKARTTLLMAIPEDHLSKFHKMTDAKEMWEAIKSKFGRNNESKKMQKYILKKQFEGFSVSNSEGLHKGYDRF